MPREATHIPHNFTRLSPERHAPRGIGCSDPRRVWVPLPLSAATSKDGDMSHRPRMASMARTRMLGSRAPDGRHLHLQGWGCVAPAANGERGEDA